MAISAFFRLFHPKDKVFYTLFEEVSNNLVIMSNLMVERLASNEPVSIEFYKEMEDGEHENDRITHNIFMELGKNFITPFDREDVHQLATSLDDIADFMYASVKYLKLYKTPILPSFKIFADHINDSVLELQKAIYNLRDFRDPKLVMESCVEINRIENIVDDLFSNELGALFESGRDVIDIIKIKNVLEYLEDVTDKCEHSANIIESIIVKYA